MAQTDFNPRTPHGVRLNRAIVEALARAISTHAPLTGCDLLVMYAASQGGRFQPTHPSRGATTPCRNSETTEAYFNPRTPHGVRLQISQALARPLLFQPTHPSRGATHPTDQTGRDHRISTHAPLTGCDSIPGWHMFSGRNFNPRTPHGVRHYTLRITYTAKVFQPTHPSRGATRRSCAPAICRKFQPTHPSRGATRDKEGKTIPYQISTHAPLTGCDSTRPAGNGWRNYFNPRTPHGVRPGHVWTRTEYGDISTHAPLTGCDLHLI